MKLPKVIIKVYKMNLLVIGLLSLIILACSPAKRVVFETPVDTTSKRIKYQIKKTFSLEKLGVYASNEFDGARLNGFEYFNDSTALVTINPENGPINNSAYFAFKAWSKTPKSFYFKFKYPDGYNHRYLPKLNKNGAWSLLDSIHLFKNEEEVTIEVALNEQPITIAAQEIHASKDVKKWYQALSAKHSQYVQIGEVGKTVLGRDIPVLNIRKNTTSAKSTIVLLTRQHPPEVTGYFAFQAFLTAILKSPHIEDLLEKFHILAFPIMNPDGVDLGNWRHNAGGVDLNRDWGVYNQPEIKQVVSYINTSLKRNKSKLILGLDFHSTWYDVFYTNTERQNTAFPTFVEDWFSALENEMPGYKVNEAQANSKKPTSKGWFLNGHQAVGITYEIGDATAREDINKIGSVSAQQMIELLLTKFKLND